MAGKAGGEIMAIRRHLPDLNNRKTPFTKWKKKEIRIISAKSVSYPLIRLRLCSFR
jgi:hypothetical protein